eukprot:7920867-Pyramimonas_sp.AAC.1
MSTSVPAPLLASPAQRLVCPRGATVLTWQSLLLGVPLRPGCPSVGRIRRALADALGECRSLSTAFLAVWAPKAGAVATISNISRQGSQRALLRHVLVAMADVREDEAAPGA